MFNDSSSFGLFNDSKCLMLIFLSNDSSFFGFFFFFCLIQKWVYAFLFSLGIWYLLCNGCTYGYMILVSKSSLIEIYNHINFISEGYRLLFSFFDIKFPQLNNWIIFIYLQSFFHSKCSLRYVCNAISLSKPLHFFIFPLWILDLYQIILWVPIFWF